MTDNDIQKTKKGIITIPLSFAERTGFEPANRFCRLHAFQACLFNHSSTSPVSPKTSSDAKKRACNDDAERSIASTNALY